MGGVTELNGVNAIMFDPSYKCDDKELRKVAPTPEVFAPFCGNRHVAFAAMATSHGLHRHSAAWQAQVAGYKSWYLLPNSVYTEPKDETVAETPFAFPHEEQANRKNSLCG